MSKINRFFNKFLTVERCCIVVPLNLGCYIIAIITVLEIFSPFGLYMHEFDTNHKATIGRIIYKAIVVITMVSCVLLGVCAFILILALVQDSTTLIFPWLYAMCFYVIIKIIHIPAKFYVVLSQPNITTIQSMGVYGNTTASCIITAVYVYFFLVVNSYRVSKTPQTTNRNNWTRNQSPVRTAPTQKTAPAKVKTPKEKPLKKGKVTVPVVQPQPAGPAIGQPQIEEPIMEQSQMPGSTAYPSAAPPSAVDQPEKTGQAPPQ